MQVLFRSFELDTGNEIIGHYVQEDGFRMSNGKPILDEPCIRHYMFDGYGTRHEIAPEYLSINFENMIDKNGNKIFASLSEDGVGGDDVVTCFSGTNGVAIFDGNQFLFSHDNVEVIGIHKGE